MEILLRNKFGEVFVHTERMFDLSKNSVDFYIYAPRGNFGVDVFYPNNIKTLQSNLNIKQKKYRGFCEKLYYVVANQDIDQACLEKSANSKRKPLSDNEKLMSFDSFLALIQEIETYPNPLPT